MQSSSQQYDFRKFIESVKEMNFAQIIQYTEREIGRIENRSYNVKGAACQKQLGSLDYVNRVGEFLFWLRNGVKPLNASEEDFQLYRIVADRLVAKGQFKPTILDEFKKTKA